MLRRRLYAEWVLVAILASLFVGVASFQGWFVALDNRIYDLASELAAPPVDDRILLVEIDEASLREFGRWPWTRDVHARGLQTLAKYKPAAIAYNVLFLDATPNDAMLGDALVQAHPVYLPAAVETDSERVLTPPELLEQSAAQIGAALLLADSDGIVRRAERTLTVDGNQFDQLPTLLTQRAKVANIRSSRSEERFLIAYNRNNAFRRVSFASLAKGEVPAALVTGKLVLVGVTAAGVSDAHAVPIAAGSNMSGVEVQANVANTLLTGTAITAPQPRVIATFALLPLLILLGGFLRFAPGPNILLAIGLAVGTLLIAVAMLPFARIWLPPSATLMGLILVHALWGWRRLTVVNAFLRTQARALQSEPGVLTPSGRSGLFGDVIAAEALRLESVIGQVRLLRNFIEHVLERFPDAVFVTDAGNRVVMCNQAAKTLVGSDPLASPISEVICTFCPETAVVGIPIRSYSNRSLLMANTPIDDEHRIVSFTDVTELQRSTEEREDLLQFLSHDLRAPNAAIVWLLEAEEMESGVQTHEAMPKSLRNQIKANARHGLSLADNFVQLVRARRRPLVREPVDLRDVACEAADMVAAYARTRGTQLLNQSDTGELWVWGDQSMLLRAAINLLENAVKFAPDQSTVIYAVKQQAGEIVYTVTGPGPPMPAGRRDDPFSLYAEGRAADSQNSIGLGLSFVQTTATRHNGEAIYIYHEGHGAEFQIKLPIALLDD